MPRGATEMTTINELVNMVKRVGLRIDALSLDLARDGGNVVRNAQGLAEAVQTMTRATPRDARIGQVATALFARQRWLRLAATARTGVPKLRPEDHRDLAKRTAAYAAELRG